VDTLIKLASFKREAPNAEASLAGKDKEKDKEKTEEEKALKSD
jgi:hypothetical protein